MSEIPVVTPDEGTRFRIDTTIFPDSTSEPVLVIFEDGGWEVVANLFSELLVEDSPRPVHQVIPMIAVLRDYAEYDRITFG